MKILMTAVACLTLLAPAPVYAAKNKSFASSGSGEKKWKNYYCINASYRDSREIFDITFGTCEGSRNAEEEEPVNTVEIKNAKHNPDLAATSQEWRNASAFDLSSPELGSATLYINQETFSGTEEKPVVRLKVSEKASTKELRLTCGKFGS